MAITFPNSPSTNDTHTSSNGIVYKYDGEKWKTIGSDQANAGVVSGDNVSVLTNDAGYVTSSGVTPEGEVVKSTTNSNEANTKFLRADGDGTCSWQTPPDTDTTYSVGDGGLTQNNFTDADHTKLDGIAAGANVGAALTGSTNNTICTVTGANAMQGEANLTFDGGATGDATLTIHAQENDPNSEPILKLESSNDFAESIIQAADSTGIAGSLHYNHGDNAWRVLGGSSYGEKLRIDSSGNVGINESSSLMSNGKLTVKIDTDKHIGFNGAQGEVGSVPALVAYQDNGSLASIGFRGTDIRFATGSAERARITDDGLCLGGTGSANALDDYEEGYHTPVISTNATSGSITYGSGQAWGKYTKVGNLCHYSFDVEITAWSGASGVCRVSIPITARNWVSGTYGWSYDSPQFWSVNSNFVGSEYNRLTGYIQGGGTTLLLYVLNASNSLNSFTLNTTGRISGSITYHTG